MRPQTVKQYLDKIKNTPKWASYYEGEYKKLENSLGKERLEKELK